MLVDSAIRDFGNSMGMDSLEFEENGVILLDIENQGSFIIRKNDSFSVFTLGKPYDYITEKLIQNAFQVCDEREDHPMPIAPVFFNKTFIGFKIAIDNEAIDLPKIEIIFELLSKTNTRLENLGS